jgi:hypothetical protein
MTTTLRTRLPALAALAVLTVTGTTAIAQTAPAQVPDASRQGGVREILNRAETEGARRTIGDILGAAAGVSRAQAQTPPAQTPPRNPPAAGPVTAQAGNAQAPAAPVATDASQRPPVTIAQSAPASQQPAPPVVLGPAPASQGQGTAADPTMIVRVPATDAPPADAPADAAAQGQAERSSAPATVAAAPAAGPAPDAPAVVAQAAARPGVIAVRRVPGHVPVRVWCPPMRW